MKIAEIFYSIQGEGILVGVPSVFIRTSGCNLRCVWCDTPYTSWTPEGEQIAIDEIVSQCTAAGARHAVITGGEPMLFKDTVALAGRLRELGFHITIETAGTLWQELDCQLMSISPKLANSTPPGEWHDRHEKLRYQPDVLRRLIGAYDYQLKFVIAAPADVDEAGSIVAEIDADPSRVILMPEGTDAAVIRDRAQWLVELCKERNYRYSPRLQVDIWSDHRGK